MSLPQMKAGFVGFGEVNSPRDLIEAKVRRACDALEARGLDLVATAPVSDDPLRKDETRAIADLKREDFDFLVICLAGWIPSHSVIDIITHFRHKPMVLWGLTGEMIGGRLVTTADQAGTSALRDPMETLGFRFRYIYDTIDAPYAGADKVVCFGKVARAAALLKHAKIGHMGWRDMTLYGTLADIPSLRRVVGPDIEVFETLEISQRMARQDPAEIARVAAYAAQNWVSDTPLTSELMEDPARLYLAIMEKARERDFQAVSLNDVDGVKKLLGFTPASALMLLSDLGGLATIPENDALGSVTQLIVRYLTEQAGAYFEFYEFFRDRLLMGVPDFVPAGVVDGPVRVRVTKFGDLAPGILNVSKVKTGRATICRLVSRGDRYKMHIVTGEAVTPRPWEEAGWTPPAPQLPSIEFIPDCPVDEFTQQVYSQHYVVAYGDYRTELRDLCKLLGIEAV
jgi:hypothetical protein